MQICTDIHTYTHMAVLPEVHTLADISLPSISGSIYSLSLWKKYYTVIDLCTYTLVNTTKMSHQNL